MPPTTKSPATSKTLWVNLIIAVAAFFPVAQTFLSEHPLVLAEAFAVINIGLRLFTKDKLSLGD